MISVEELRKEARRRAREGGFDSRDADVLLSDMLNKPLSWVIAHGEESVDPGDVESLREKLERRSGGEPLQYIRGYCEFYGREILVDERVLVPRPETEHLVEAVVERAREGGRVVDVGTGSGCIALTIALERPDLEVSASDISFRALSLARRNLARHEAAVSLVAGNTLDCFTGSFDVIVSNPPYVPRAMVDTLQREVRDWEPIVALSPGEDGLKIIAGLMEEGRRLLNRKGFLAMEIGFNQREDVERLARQLEWELPEFVGDLAGIPRVAILKRRAVGEGETAAEPSRIGT